MKRNILPLLLFLLCLINANEITAQNQEWIDSLKMSLQTTPPGPDKFKTYGKISWYYLTKTDFDQAKSYADSLRISAENLNDESGIAYAEFYYGVIARFTGENHKALDHLNKYVVYYTAAGDSAKVSHGLYQMASVKSNMGDYDKSIEILYRALRIHEYQNDQKSINFTLNNIGTILKQTKQYDEAIKIFQKALLTDSLNSDLIMNLGNVYNDIGALEKAEEYYLKALALDEKNGDDRYVAFDLENLGNIYIKMNDYNKALDYGKRALHIRQDLPFKIELQYSLKQLGIIYSKKNELDVAIDYLTQAEHIALETQAKNELKDIHQHLAKIYAMKGDFGKAFEFQKSYSILNDSLINKETQRQINEVKIKYETEKKDQQIALLAAEKERQATLNKIMLGGILFFVILALLIFYVFRMRLQNQKAMAAKNEEIKEVNFRRQLTELEMKALRAQINPHFIFNCMNSINQMIKNSNNQNASKYLTKFSKLIRSTLENAERTEVSLQDELETLKAYIQLETPRFKEDINFEIQIEDDIDPEQTYLPTMVLQPFVENAIWHGLRHKKESGNGKISITINQEEDKLICRIEDNGVGREKAFELQEKTLLKSKSLGLKITEDRLKLLSKELQKQLIRIIDLKDQAGKALGTRVEVNIPITS